MHIPRYWAECRKQVRSGPKQFTILRFGWSDSSQVDAELQAEARVEAAHQAILSGESLHRRDQKRGYSRSQGVPIREEIVEEIGDIVFTRNSYGANCLNTPNVFFADIDFPHGAPCNQTMFIILLLQIVALVAMWWTKSIITGIVLGVLSIPVGNLLSWAFYRSILNSHGGDEELACSRVRRFVDLHPEWNVRLYRTPLGLRVLATHSRFSPKDTAVTECFSKFASDPLYMKMCNIQECFRARVSPKPWRIGIRDRICGGVWPIADHLTHSRAEWIARYETVAKGFSSCKFIQSYGSGVVHKDVRPVIELHDLKCKSHSGLSIA